MVKTLREQKVNILHKFSLLSGKNEEVESFMEN
jgi:hypothetical protein